MYGPTYSQLLARVTYHWGLTKRSIQYAEMQKMKILQVFAIIEVHLVQKMVMFG